MNLLESWVIVMWLVYADGEANQFTPPNVPQVLKHLTKDSCQEIMVRTQPEMERMAEQSENIISGHSACYKVQDSGTKL